MYYCSELARVLLRSSLPAKRRSQAIGAFSAVFGAVLVAALGNVLRAELIIHQRFDSISGSTFTDSAGNYDGTATGGAALDGATTKLGAGSALFDGTSNVNLGNTDSDLTGIAGFTLSTWINPNTLATTENGEDGIFSNTAATKASVIFRLDGDSPTGRLETGLYTNGNWGGNPDTFQSSGAVTADAWSHVALVWDGTEATTYINGTLSSTHTAFSDGTLDRQGGPPTPDALIGNSFNGNIDDFAIWDEDLTADELISLVDVANNSDLLYTAGEFDQLKSVHDATSGSIEINDITWEYATGLSGGAGLSGSSGAYNLVLDSVAGTGLVTTTNAVPEPASIATWLLVAMTLFGFGYRQARRRKS